MSSKLKIPSHHLSLYDYHHVADIVENKRYGRGVYVPQKLIFELEPELETDYVTKQKFELCKSMFEWYNSQTNINRKFGLPRSTVYLLYASFFYENYKEFTVLDEICGWSTQGIPYESEIKDKITEQVTPFLEKQEVRDKLNEGFQRKLDNFIAKVGLLIEQEKESKGETEDHQDGVPVIHNHISETDAGYGVVRNSTINDTNFMLQHISPRFYISTLNESSDEVDESELSAQEHMIVNLAGGLVNSSTLNIGIISLKHSFPEYTVREWTFRSVFFENKTYNRGDSVVFSLTDNIMDLNFYVCTKDNTITDNPDESEFWFRLPGYVAARYHFFIIGEIIENRYYGLDSTESGGLELSMPNYLDIILNRDSSTENSE